MGMTVHKLPVLYAVMGGPTPMHMNAVLIELSRSLKSEQESMRSSIGGL